MAIKVSSGIVPTVTFLKKGTGVTGGRASLDNVGARIHAKIGAGVRKSKAPLERAMLLVYEELEARHSRKWVNDGSMFGPRSPKDSLLQRNGEGLRSIKKSISVKGDRAGGMIATINAGRLAIHETGGTIRPTRKRYLAIPTTAVLSSRGNKLGNTRDWDRTFIRKSKGGNLFIFQRRGKELLPLYLLRKSIKITKGRLGLKAAFDKVLPQAKGLVVAAIMSEVRK